MQSAQTSANAPSSTDESALSGCDCGSTDAGKPCKSQFVEYVAGTSKIRFDFQCAGGDCKCGKFANQHDYWVAPVSANGTVHLTRMSPEVIGTPGEGNYRNGWVVNPDDQSKVGLDGRFFTAGNFKFPQNPSTAQPYVIETSQGIQSLWKADHYPDAEVGDNCTAIAANGDTRMCFLQTALLTVLPNVPEQAGTTVLRPPYFGPSKPLYLTTQLNLNFFPNLPLITRPSGDAVKISWDKALGDLKFPDADWGYAWPATQVHHAKFNWYSPLNNGYPAYAPQENRNNALALLMFATSSPEELAKKELLKIRAIQQGLDILGIVKHGAAVTVNGVMRGGFTPNGGHSVGRFSQALIAAHAISKVDPQWKNLLIEVSSSEAGRLTFPETGQFSFNSTTGKYTYGVVNAAGGPSYQPNCTTGLTPCQSNSIRADPAGNYDDWPAGGNQGAYQAIAWNATFFAATIARAIPALRPILYAGTDVYVRRMIAIGTYTNASVATPLMPLSYCATGANVNRICNTDNDCGSGHACNNKQTNFSNFIWPAANAWQTYDACLDSKTCEGMVGL